MQIGILKACAQVPRERAENRQYHQPQMRLIELLSKVDDGRALPPLWTLHGNLCFAVGAALGELNAVASVPIRNRLAFFPSGGSRSECIST